MVKAASAEWVDDNVGSLVVENLLDGSDSREQSDSTCYHTTGIRGPDFGKPYANFSIINPMKVARVEVLTRNYPQMARDPLYSLINMRVFSCYGDLDCQECPMEDKASLSENTFWVHYLCSYEQADLVVLTNDLSYHVIACEVKAFGYP